VVVVGGGLGSVLLLEWRGEDRVALFPPADSVTPKSYTSALTVLQTSQPDALTPQPVPRRAGKRGVERFGSALPYEPVAAGASGAEIGYVFCQTPRTAQPSSIREGASRIYGKIAFQLKKSARTQWAKRGHLERKRSLG